MQAVRVTPIQFINAEPGVIPMAGRPIPAVVLSFGGEEGPIEDRAVGIIDARQMVMDIIESLANMGDPLAQAIGQQFFSGSPQAGDEGDEFDTGSDYDDGYGGCNGGSCGG